MMYTVWVVRYLLVSEEDDMNYCPCNCCSWCRQSLTRLSPLNKSHVLTGQFGRWIFELGDGGYSDSTRAHSSQPLQQLNGMWMSAVRRSWSIASTQYMDFQWRRIGSVRWIQEDVVESRCLYWRWLDLTWPDWVVGPCQAQPSSVHLELDRFDERSRLVGRCSDLNDTL
jgi:hypothetical protein